MLDEITDCAVSGWLQDVFLKDEEYQKLGEEEKKAAAPQEVFPPGIETQEELEALKARLWE